MMMTISRNSAIFLGVALATFLMFLFFRAAGIAFAILVFGIWFQFYNDRPTIGWRTLLPLFNALWITPVICMFVAYLIGPDALLQSDIVGALAKLPFTYSPFEKVILTIRHNGEFFDRDTLEAKAEIDRFWRWLYPGAFLGYILGGLVFAICLPFILLLKIDISPTANQRSMRVATLGGLAFVLAGFLYFSLTTRSLLPSNFSALGRIRPITVSAIYWFASFFMAFFFQLTIQHFRSGLFSKR
jgi:hypothetical protein